MSLLRLALRRDRVRLSVWIAVLTLMMVYAPNAIKLAYPEEAQRQARVNLMKTPAAMMMGGPMFGGNETDLGAMMANELMLTLIVATSILAILTVIRHTRAEEESGAAELVLSSVVGRYARTYAALILVGGGQRRAGGHDDAGDGLDRLRGSSTPRRCASASPAWPWCSARWPRSPPSCGGSRAPRRAPRWPRWRWPHWSAGSATSSTTPAAR